MNDGTGVFADATASQMPPDPKNTTFISMGDVDGDGALDALFGNSTYTLPPHLFLNEATFRMTTDSAMAME